MGELQYRPSSKNNHLSYGFDFKSKEIRLGSPLFKPWVCECLRLFGGAVCESGLVNIGRTCNGGGLSQNDSLEECGGGAMKIFRIQTSIIAATLLMAIYSFPSSAELASTPLSLKGAVPPNIMFALSVEYPTATTPAYQDTNSYSRNNNYLGYFDPDKCYAYGGGLTSGSVTGWFYPIGPSAKAPDNSPTSSDPSHACATGWSGNFLNWASMAGLDEFRYAMTGGNRVVDLPDSGTNPGGLTVLERSFQSNQGSLFQTKTFTEDGYTAGAGYSSGATMTIVNQGKGTVMTVSASGTGTVTCVGPQKTTGGFNCGGGGYTYGYSISNGETANCNTYTGSGTSASPYQCTAFDNMKPSNDAVTTPSASTPNFLASSPTAGSVTVNCPAKSFTSSPYACSATLSNGTIGTCQTSGWVGDGSASSPYMCTSFNLFSTAAFAISLPLSSPNVTGSTPTTDTLTTTATDNNIACTVSGGSSSTPPTTVCNLSDGQTASCSGSAYTSSNPSYCNSFTISGTDSFVSQTHKTTSTTAANGKKYANTYSIKYKVNTPSPVYYYSTYNGSYGTPIYYYSTYSVSFGAAAADYQVRVRVCNPDTSVGGKESNCQQYGNTWKPTGVVQDNSAAMRFGVTSYFNAGDVDNAVLRSKAKFVGPIERLLSGTTGNNARTEWSDVDGHFINNPDSGDADTMSTPWGTAPANSGVVNYINKFGYTSQNYKTLDDVGKLYYETLKYLRGGNLTGSTTTATTRPATSIFYNGAKQANSDGFPVITTWDDPVKYSCQKNYIITMGDTHTWCDKKMPGGTYASNGDANCNAYTDGNSHSHTTDTGSLSGDGGIIGKINGTALNAATGTADATNVVGVMENLAATTSATIPPVTTSTLATTLTGAGGGGIGSGSYYMAGLAAWAATNNIRPDMAPNSSPMNVKTFVIDVQENKDCGYQKQFWLAAKYGDPNNYAPDANNSTSMKWKSSAPWYNSVLGNSFSCDSNAPANYSSSSLYMQWPKNLLRAGDPESMISSVKSALQSIAAEQGDEASLAQSKDSLQTGTGAYIYQGSYNTGGWSGDMKAFVINQSGVESTVADWSASQMLPKPSDRKVVTFNRATNAGVYFTLAGGTDGLDNFDAYQKALLGVNDLGVADTFGADRVKYIRGDMTNEANLPSSSGATTANTQANHAWRSRLAEGTACDYSTVPATCLPALAGYTTGPTGQLGDVIFSSPVFIDAPSLAIPDASYKVFANAHLSRTPMVYVGGNDGMLHAFNAAFYLDATTFLPSRCPKMSGSSPAFSQPPGCVASSVTSYSGTEVFGYVPYATYPALNTLMSTNYSHKYFVDGSPVVGDVCVSSTALDHCAGSNDSWMTILAGGLNAGGKGVYALNITDPVAGFAASNVLWEFTNLDDPDLGYTFSKPTIRKLNNKRWAVIFGNGFDSVNAVTNPGNQNAYLYILYVDPQLDSSHPWVEGTNYFKITLTSPTGTPNNASNGLASVSAVDVNQDGMIDHVYGGDRNGNMWKVDLTSSSPAAWTAAFSGQPLFTAKDDAGHLQQITTPPTVSVHPNGGYIVTFGTGSWIDKTDTTIVSGHPDSLYGIWDKNDGATSSPATGRNKLQRQAVLDNYSVDNSVGASCTSGTANCVTHRIQSKCPPNYTTTATTASNQSDLCPQYVPTYPPASPVTYTAKTLASPSGTTQRLGWFMDFPDNGERTHSDPPLIIGSNVQYMSLTPAVDLCTGNTVGMEYDLPFLTGEAMSLPLFQIPGNTTGYIWWTPPGGGPAIQVVVSGKSTVGGAANNPISFDIAPPSASGVLPVPCTTGNCKMVANNFIPGWGFMFNMNQSAQKQIISCYPKQSGGALLCERRNNNGKSGRLSWKKIN